MAWRKLFVWVPAVCVTFGGVVVSTAQEKEPAVSQAVEAIKSGEQPAAASVDRIMDHAARNIARRYNLNKAQADFTRDLMRRKVYEFLEDHEGDVWPVIRDLLRTGLGGRAPDNAEQMQRIGRAAGPLVALAEEAIISANKEWGEILEPDQKKTHDYDMAKMREQFAGIDRNFKAWAEGRHPDGGIFPRKEKSAAGPPRPERPFGGLPPASVGHIDPKSLFDTVVEEFIKDYELEVSQIASARSILDEFRAKAASFLETNKVELAQSLAEQRDARRLADAKRIRIGTAKHKKLLAPVYGLLDEMEGRLKKLLTTAQIDRYAQKTAAPQEKRAARTSPKKPKAADPTDANSHDADDSEESDSDDGGW